MMSKAMETKQKGNESHLMQVIDALAELGRLVLEEAEDQNQSSGIPVPQGESGSILEHQNDMEDFNDKPNCPTDSEHDC